MASKTISLGLSRASIKDVIDRLGVLQDNIEVACEEMVAELVEKGHELAVLNDNNGLYSGNGEYDFFASSDRNKGYISMEGPDSVYVEFGTGDVGASNPHPLHNEVDGINPYNSGPTIRFDDKGNHYWVYPPLAKASKYYMEGGLTYGIPAGCQMYSTLVELQELAPNVAKEHLQKAINSRLI